MFNDDVVIVGDGVSSEEKIISGEDLHKYDSLYN